MLALNPGVVIVASGGLPDMGDITGLDLCLSSWDVLSGDPVNGQAALVFDETARHAGCGHTS